MRIGLLDSGIGGISVARSVVRLLPHYHYVYYADDLHMPYGDKSPAELFELVTRGLTVLFQVEQCSLVILACNTASTVLPRIQRDWLPVTFPDRKVLGIIRPTVEYMTEKHRQYPIYVLATPRTVASQAYDHELKKIHKTCEFHEIGCPKLAESIERSDRPVQDQRVYALCEEYLATIPTNQPVVMYTGCTHYAFVGPIIRHLRPKGILIHQGHIVSTKLVEYLSHHPEIKNVLEDHDSQHPRFICSSGQDTYTLKLKRIFEK